MKHYYSNNTLISAINSRLWFNCNLYIMIR
jgi:hypothetical protein